VSVTELPIPQRDGEPAMKTEGVGGAAFVVTTVGALVAEQPFASVTVTV
jgi:hypothetical protein